MGNLLPYNSPKDASASAQPDLLVQAMGAYGKFQCLIVFLTFSTKLPISMNQMSVIFLAPAKMTFKCDGVPEACPCANPEWDTSMFKTTIQMEWNLICERKLLTSTNQSLFQFGVLIGSLIFGMAADRFGRKMPLIAAVVLQAIAGFGAAIANSFVLFTICRFLIGVFSGATMVVSFVILMEFIGTKYRSTAAVFYQVVFNAGLMFLPLTAYFLRDWRYFQFAITIPSTFQFFIICFLAESPRWLIGHRKTEKAIAVVERVARMNRLPVDTVRANVQAFQEEAERHKLKTGSLVDFIHYPYMLKNLICMAFNWFSCAYYFYGMSQYAGLLSGNIFINVAFTTTLSLFGSLISLPFLRFTGRRTTILINNFICVLAMVLLTIMPKGIPALISACLGIMSSFCIFVVIYLHTSELFPTVVRNTALGFCSMCGRVGSMISPYIIELKDIAYYWPTICFAIPPLFAGILCFFLNETAGFHLTITLEEGEEFAKGKKPASS